MISKEDVKKLAVLARITISDKEAESLATEAEGILGYVFDVGEASAAGEGDAHTARVNVMREDGNPHEPGAHTDAVLSAAPKTENGYIEVRQVIQKEE
jgi:aspartyl-tRNA(Asn)/glutamyl-tRNA(Gln) amidotransferase subunit C